MQEMHNDTQQHTLIYSPKIYALVCPQVGCMDPSVVTGLTTVGTVVCWLPSGPVGCQALPQGVTASPLMGKN